MTNFPSLSLCRIRMPPQDSTLTESSLIDKLDGHTRVDVIDVMHVFQLLAPFLPSHHCGGPGAQVSKTIMPHFWTALIWLFAIFSLAPGLAILNDRRLSSGCGSTPSWSFNKEGHHTRSLNGRSYLVHIPASYNVNTSHPTVLSFHAFEEDPQNQELISGFSAAGLEINGTVSTSKTVSYLSLVDLLGPGHHCGISRSVGWSRKG